MQHLPVFIVMQYGRVLGIQSSRPGAELLVRRHTTEQRGISARNAVEVIEPEIFKGAIARFNVDCGILGERSAAVTYTKFEDSFGEFHVSVVAFDIDRVTKTDHPSDQWIKNELALMIEDNLNSEI